jgi:hypothetical protein
MQQAVKKALQPLYLSRRSITGNLYLADHGGGSHFQSHLVPRLRVSVDTRGGCALEGTPNPPKGRGATLEAACLLTLWTSLHV